MSNVRSPRSPRRVLVTGGAGFIGSHLVRRLLEEGTEVTVVDDLSAPSALPVPSGVTWHRLRLPDARLRAIVAEGRFDRIYHLAGAAYVPPSIEDPSGDLANNADVTLDVLEAVRRGSPRTPVVYTSSAAVYGSPTVLPISEATPIVPVSPYGVSKYAAEQYVSLYARLHGLRTGSLRLFSVFGPGQRKQVVFDLIAKLAADPERLDVIGAGTEMRDFIFVDDVVTAAALVMSDAPLEGEVYNVASGVGVTIRELVGHVVAVLGLTPAVRYTGEVRPGDALHWVGDISRLRALGFVPAVPVEAGVRRIAEWFAELESRVSA
ncbi:MAG TPA: NAD-dependent epimerase/dehydratase family protein [Gemmatimonadales bacterium]|nr:NAD-dependent epimerase/dehydratase family protein [Gemmatimonadales bacterium]